MFRSKHHLSRFVIALLCASVLHSCGDPRVVSPTYDEQPKIVMRGFLLPHQDVKVLITRSFPLDPESRISKFALLIEDADVSLADVSNDLSYILTYNPETLQYESRGDELDIAHGLTYRLDVAATVDGERLQASSTTTVPHAGFEVVDSASVLGPLRYQERDENDEVRQFEIAFRRSRHIDFYVISISAVDARTETFVYDNPFVDHDASDVNFFFDDLVTAFEWSQSLPTDPEQEPVISTQVIQWRQLLFHGRYRAIIYAADENFKGFFLTHSTLQEIDGNFHEPDFRIEGDGLGVFGSAIADTVFFEVISGTTRTKSDTLLTGP